MFVGKGALGHQRVSDRDVVVLDEVRQRGPGAVREVHRRCRSVDVRHPPSMRGDLLGDAGLEARADSRPGAAGRPSWSTHAAEKTSIGTLSSTAPGRPEVAVQKARSANRVRSSTRLTVHARFTNGR